MFSSLQQNLYLLPTAGIRGVGGKGDRRCSQETEKKKGSLDDVGQSVKMAMGSRMVVR